MKGGAGHSLSHFMVLNPQMCLPLLPCSFLLLINFDLQHNGASVTVQTNSSHAARRDWKRLKETERDWKRLEEQTKNVRLTKKKKEKKGGGVGMQVRVEVNKFKKRPT